MEMSISIPKDMPANLSAASVFPPIPSAGAENGKVVINSSTDNGFSKKLSEAIDKSAKPEPIAPKKGQKPQKTSDQEPIAETATTVLAVGMAGNPPLPEVPPNDDSAPNTVNSTVTATINRMDVSGAFAQGIPVIVQGTGNQPLGIGKQEEFEAVASQAVFMKAVATEPQTGKPIQTQQSKISLAAVNTQAGITEESISSQSSSPPISAEFGLNQENTPSDSHIQQDIVAVPVSTQLPTQVVTTSQPNSSPVSAEFGLNQENTPIDSRVQQDIVDVQVSTQPPNQVVTTSQPIQDTMATTASGAMGISQTTPANAMITTAEIEPAEVDSANMTGKAEARPEPVATTQTEQEPAEQNLGRSEKDTLALDSTDNTETAAVTIAPFEKALSSVNSPVAPDPTMQQSRQDIHEVARQVMDGMTASTGRLKSSQMIITLKPEHLGEVTVKINVDGDRVTAAFHAASSEVRAILESSLPQLRQEMSQNGWNFDSDGVYGGMQQFLANQQQQQRQAEQGQTVIRMAQRLNRDEYEDSISAFTPTGRLQVMSAAAVDYRV